MTKAVGLLVEGFSYIGKSICPRFEPLSRTPFLDSRRVLSFDKMLELARQRNAAFFKQLGID